MKCKYCGSKLRFGEWIVGLGKCVHCEVHMSTKELEIRRKRSDEYWKDKK